MSNADEDIDWSKTTWEGSRREQLRRWRKLTLRERMLAVEEMADLSQRFSDMRSQRQSRNGQADADLNRTKAREVREPGPDPGEPTAHYLTALRAADRND